MSAPVVSVIMAVYNTPEEYLRAAIASVLQQTFTDFELLVLDDGSTPEAHIHEIVASYNDDRIRFIPGEHEGAANTRNRGILAARGQFIACLDSDDVALPERLTRQVAFLTEHSEIGLLGTWAKCIPNGNEMRYPERVSYFDLLYKDCLVHSTVMWRREDFIRHNLFYTANRLGEDYELWSRAIKYVEVANLCEVLVHYRVHPQQLCAQSTSAVRAESAALREQMLRWLSRNPRECQEITALCAKFHGKPLTWGQRVFSLRNEGAFKVLRILGLCFRFPKK